MYRKWTYKNGMYQVTGPLSHYLDGVPVNDKRALLPSTIHAHEKCIEWYVIILIHANYNSCC
jgi:hypothetical protein